MQLTTKRRVAFGLGTVGLTAGGVLAAGFGLASAQAGTIAAGSATQSPGVLSGNLVQIPVNVPVNICGNQATVIGLLDSVVGNTCGNAGSAAPGGNGTVAAGGATGSPGVLSGNLIQAPVNAPVNICGNQVNVVGIGDTTSGNSCANGGGSGTDAGTGNGTIAAGGATGSPGVGSGNSTQIPINAPVNVCGNQAVVVGALNSVLGEQCGNGGATTSAGTPGSCGCGTPTPPPPPPPVICPPPVIPGSVTPPIPGSVNTGPAAAVAPVGSLAETGTGPGVLAGIPFAGGLLGGGAFLTRRFTPGSN